MEIADELKLREITSELNFLSRSDGSSIITQGKNLNLINFFCRSQILLFLSIL
jgi:ribonuclease PH